MSPRRAFNDGERLMRLNHLDLPVPDIAATRDFFETWMGFTHNGTLGRDGLAILHDESGLVLVLSRLQRDGAQAFPATFHIGFHLESEDAVRTLHERLHGAGLAHDGPTQQRGAYAFYFMAPGDILVEVAHRA
jgi:catechol 2,3-dioxygenase-like lactoylglutathione lyase family enzyme